MHRLTVLNAMVSQEIHVVNGARRLADIHSQFVPTSFSYAPVTRLIRPKK